MRNIRLVLEFDGSGFSGWQYQPGHRTVQGEIESALEKIVGKPATAYGCSRTDSGVSARNYVANVVTESGLDPERLRRALNFHLPRDIFVKQVEDVPITFHARHSATSKTYLYRIVRGRSPLRSGQAWELRFPVDTARIRRAMKPFAGRHDFAHFCHLSSPGPGVCTLFRIELSEHDDEIRLRVKGDRFLYKMVRRIVGAVVTYGTGGITLADIRAALAGRKHQSFPTAPACGLLLDSVSY